MFVDYTCAEVSTAGRYEIGHYILRTHKKLYNEYTINAPHADKSYLCTHNRFKIYYF